MGPVTPAGKGKELPPEGSDGSRQVWEQQTVEAFPTTRALAAGGFVGVAACLGPERETDGKS